MGFGEVLHEAGRFKNGNISMIWSIWSTRRKKIRWWYIFYCVVLKEKRKKNEFLLCKRWTIEWKDNIIAFVLRSRFPCYLLVLYLIPSNCLLEHCNANYSCQIWHLSLKVNLKCELVKIRKLRKTNQNIFFNPKNILSNLKTSLWFTYSLRTRQRPLA